MRIVFGVVLCLGIAPLASADNDIDINTPTTNVEYGENAEITVGGTVSYDWFADDYPYSVELKVVDWNGVTVAIKQADNFYAAYGSGSWSGTVTSPWGPPNPVQGQNYVFSIEATSYDKNGGALDTDAVFGYEQFS